MQKVLLEQIEIEDLIYEVQRIHKRLDKLDEVIAGTKISYVPIREVLKTLNISRATADEWHRQGILNKKYIGSKVYYSTKEIEKRMEDSI
tara:strand:- start:140 stop:409 length:270 start_codon:yes stop_codon:yes gene_type:complete